MPTAAGYAWRVAALTGLAAGLALAGLADGYAPVGVTELVIAVLVLVLFRPGAHQGNAGTLVWVGVAGLVAALAGLTIGTARLATIDSAALIAPEGEEVDLVGTVVSPPRLVADEFRFTLETAAGRVTVTTPGLPEGLDEGRRAELSGTVREPAPWEAPTVEREGARLVVDATAVRALRGARGGISGALDDVRRRAEAALDRGTPELSSALLRGFVLGQDDLIPEDVRDEFRRSGLAHVLAVSGQNVMLLAILTLPILALLGVPLRLRLALVIAVIAVYVPVAGAGASIQRAGVMGAAGLVAALSSRPRAALYALGLAAAVTLAVDPRATSDIGWQLSFAAVAGLLVLARPISRAFGPPRQPWRRALADGAAITLAATLATGPLVAHHFGTVSITAIPANLLALPAIAPAMWLGMLAAALGQIPGAPVEALTWLGGVCAGFIGWVAHVLGPAGAQLDIPEPGPIAALIATVVLVGLARIACECTIRRGGLAPSLRIRRPALVGGACLVSVAAAIAAIGLPSGDDRENPRFELTVIDVGQGDAILLRPRGADPVLIDTGPPGGDVAESLSGLGVERLGAVVITHDDLDHSGDLAGLLARFEIERLVTSGPAPGACAVRDCPPVEAVREGDAMRIGTARLEILWPPPTAPIDPENRNATALVMRVACGDFDALLTGDAEAESAPYATGPVDVLKVAHHGSDDAGLPTLLDRSAPQLALISVGESNPFGHPTAGTAAALDEAAVPVLRTDESGNIVISVTGDGWTVG